MARSYKFGIVGHPVRHSFSPAMHQASFESLGIDAEYLLLDTPPSELGARIERCRAEGFDGVNVTIPHKQDVLPMMVRVEPLAEIFGAVNTVHFAAEGPVGYNTDATGFLMDLDIHRGVRPEGLRILVVGCGGAGRAVAAACAREGAAAIGLVDRTPEKSAGVAHDIAERLPEIECELDVLSLESEIWLEYGQGCDLVVHCTSSGINEGDESPIPAMAFRRGQLLYDLVYTSRETPVMRVAASAGADTMNGIGMLLYQGAAAFKIWTGLEPDAAAMRGALERAVYAAG